MAGSTGEGGCVCLDWLHVERGRRKGEQSPGLPMAEGRAGSKLGSPCTDGGTEAGSFLKSHGELGQM